MRFLLLMIACWAHAATGLASRSVGAWRGRGSLAALRSSAVDPTTALPAPPSTPPTPTPSGGFKGYQQPETKRGAYEAARRDAAERGLVLPCIILVNPYLDQNVGSVSRAMLNFGLTELRIVDPNCDYLSDSARALASGSVEVLENARTFATLKEAVADLERIMVTTVRPRHMTQMVQTPQVAAKAAIGKVPPSSSGTDGAEPIPAPATCAIVFGRERSGLTNEEVALADTIITIPTFRHFSSINLAQSVNIMCAELFKVQIELEGVAPPETWLHPRDGERMARRDDLENLFSRLESKLTSRGYQLDDYRRQLNFRNLRNIIQRILMTKAEVDLLHGVLSTLAKGEAETEGEGQNE